MKIVGWNIFLKKKTTMVKLSWAWDISNWLANEIELEYAEFGE